MSWRRPASLLLAATLAATGTVACSSSDEAAEDRAEPVFPGASWGTAAPERLGFSSDELERIAARAEEAGSSCLLVARRGWVVGEWNWGDDGPDTPRETWSVTKSVTSALVGLAVDDGDLSVQDRAATYLPSWAEGEAAEITIANLLGNDSGRRAELADVARLQQADDQAAYAVQAPQAAPPGTVWVYNDRAIQALSPILAEATGTAPEAFAADRLFGPLGMADSALRTDPSGGTVLFMGLQSTCRDLARFGLLFLNRGRWEDEQLLSETWVAASTAEPSQELNRSYGYLWWLNRRGGRGLTGQLPEGTTAPEDFQLVADLPESTYWAVGVGDQVVQVDPATETVVVRLGSEEGRVPFGPAETAAVVTDALTDPDR